MAKAGRKRLIDNPKIMVSVRMDRDLWARVKEQAQKEDRTASKWLERAILERFDALRVDAKIDL